MLPLFITPPAHLIMRNLPLCSQAHYKLSSIIKKCCDFILSCCCLCFFFQPQSLSRHVPFCFSLLCCPSIEPSLPPVHTQVLQKAGILLPSTCSVFWYSSLKLTPSFEAPSSPLLPLSIQCVIRLLCALWVPFSWQFFVALCPYYFNLVYVLWPDGSYYSLHITTIQVSCCLQIQIPDSGILGILRAGPSLHFQLSPTTLLLSNWTTHTSTMIFFLSLLKHILSLPGMSLFILFLSSSSAILSRFRAMTFLLQSLWFSPLLWGFVSLKLWLFCSKYSSLELSPLMIL